MSGIKQWHVDPDVKVLCRDCTAECCKHIGIPIDAPETWEDFQRIKHYVAHEGVSCYLDVEGDWIVEFITKCGQLNGNKCMAWGTKEYPSICTEYEMKTCVMNEEGEWWEIIFKTPADVDAHCAKKGLQGKEFTPPLPCVSVPIDEPEDLKDFDDIRWYIAHRDVSVYRKDEQWYTHLHTMCKTSCTARSSRLLEPDDGAVILRTWKEIADYCAQHKIPPPPAPEGKAALKLNAA